MLRRRLRDQVTEQTGVLDQLPQFRLQHLAVVVLRQGIHEAVVARALEPREVLQAHGVEGIHRSVGKKERSLWRDPLGHLGPGFDQLEAYVFYATLYRKSPELIEGEVDFPGKGAYPSKALDRVFRKIAWQAVLNDPCSGVTDEDGDGIGDPAE